MIHETGFGDMFYYFGNERHCWFLKQWRDNGFLESGMKLSGDEGKVDNIGDCGNKN